MNLTKGKRISTDTFYGVSSLIFSSTGILRWLVFPSFHTVTKSLYKFCKIRLLITRPPTNYTNTSDFIVHFTNAPHGIRMNTYFDNILLNTRGYSKKRSVRFRIVIKRLIMNYIITNHTVIIIEGNLEFSVVCY